MLGTPLNPSMRRYAPYSGLYLLLSFLVRFAHSGMPLADTKRVCPQAHPQNQIATLHEGSDPTGARELPYHTEGNCEGSTKQENLENYAVCLRALLPAQEMILCEFFEVLHCRVCWNL